MPQLVPLLARRAESYGKGAIVGVNGDLEHAAALCHPKMGKPMRAALGGGEALIPSTQKVGAAGASLDLPLAHKDDAWSFDHFETVIVRVADASRAIAGRGVTLSRSPDLRFGVRRRRPAAS